MKVVRAVSAWIALVALILGVPALLVVVGRGLAPGFGSGRSLIDMVMSPDDGSVLLFVFTVLAWLAWGLFTVCVIVELINAVGQPRRRIAIRGLGAGQAVAAGLVLAALSLVIAPVRVAAVPHDAPRPAPIVQTVDQSAGADHGARAAVYVSADGGSAEHNMARPIGGGEQQNRQPSKKILAVHVVQDGDDLWSIAEHYYGDGTQWRAIALSNPVIERQGPDDLVTGWKLVIPDLKEMTQSQQFVVVEAGDTLSGLAHTHLGDADRWPEIFEANRATMTDPDTLEAGQIVALPGGSKTTPNPSQVEQSRKSTTSTPEVDRTEQQRPDADTTQSDGTKPGQLERQQTPEQESVPTDPSGDTSPEAEDTSDINVVQLVAGVGGMLSAALVAGVSGRRAYQLTRRPVGQRISHPGPGGLAAERGLGRQQRPVRLAALDRVLRLVAGVAAQMGEDLPHLVAARINDDTIELELSQVHFGPPAPLTVNGRVWTLSHWVDWMAGPEAYVDQICPWPGLISLGIEDPDTDVLVNLEAFGSLGFTAADPIVARSAVLAAAYELVFQPRSAGTKVTLVDPGGELGPAVTGWAAAVDSPEVTVVTELDLVLDRLQRRAAAQRSRGLSPATSRLDPDEVDAWSIDALILLGDVPTAQRGRLARILGEAGTSIVVVGLGRDAVRARIDVEDGAARFQPGGWTFNPQLLTPTALAHTTDLLLGTGGEPTPAPWWSDLEVDATTEARSVELNDEAESLGAPEELDPSATAETDPEATDDNDVTVVRYLPRRAAIDHEETMAMEEEAPHPFVLLLGPIDLVGTRGEEPTRARKQLIEYCVWLMEHPGASSREMADGLVVADGTRRSNLSRLRSWLGSDPIDGLYLPDFNRGIRLLDSVSSDWHRLQALIIGGVNRATTKNLQTALSLVRGAPLADAAPNQWHWAETLRTDMISVIRDIGVELTDRALVERDFDLARWAAARALVAAPGDEQLLCSRVKTEYAAGNRREVERLSLQLSAHARRLGIDLADETVELLQVALEGAVRPRRVAGE